MKIPVEIENRKNDKNCFSAKKIKDISFVRWSLGAQYSVENNNFSDLCLFNPEAC